MSKLIVDDIELASGDTFPIPSSIPEDKLLPVSGGAISSSPEDLPQALNVLHHDFSTGQPQYSTYTLSVPSDQLFGVRIVFSNFRIYSGADYDLVYDAINSDTNHVVDNSEPINMRYNTSGFYETAHIGSKAGGSGYSAAGIHMGGPRNQYGANLSSGNLRCQSENWEHYLSFSKNASGKHFRKALAHGHFRRANTRSGTYCFNSTLGTSYNTEETAGGVIRPYNSSPFTQIKFRHQTSDMAISQGKIFIMEIKK